MLFIYFHNRAFVSSPGSLGFGSRGLDEGWTVRTRTGSPSRDPIWSQWIPPSPIKDAAIAAAAKSKSSNQGKWGTWWDHGRGQARDMRGGCRAF